MRIFTNPLAMIKEVERDLFEMGTRYQSRTVQDKFVANDPNFQTIELVGYAYSLTLPILETELMELLSYTGFSEDRKTWVIVESRERVCEVSLNPGKAWEHDRTFWEKFLRGGVFSYTYAERFAEQIKYVIHELLDSPNTRQAIITMYDRHQDMMNWGGRDRVPCSISYQFIVREGKLVVIYNQRSCDFLNFFPADIYLTIKLMEHISTQTGLPMGQFIHFLGSLHAFAGDMIGRGIF